MSEEQQYQGDRWTNQSKNILTNLGWDQRADSNFDIACYSPLSHSTTIDGKRKNPHGIDLLFSYFDPYRKSDIGVIVESKNRLWSGISTSNIQSFITQVYTTIECSQLDNKINELNCPIPDTGLLMIWCNDMQNYDREKFNEYLKELKIQKRKKPINIYIASNYEILRWCSMTKKVNEIKNISESFDFFYPGDNFSGGSTSASRKTYLNLTHMFSDYVFAKSKKSVRTRNGTEFKLINHVFLFTKPTIDELIFMDSCIKRYQFDDADELIIHLYGSHTELRTNIEEFLRKKEKEIITQQSPLKISIDYLEILKEVPENLSYWENY